jgi:hypothetical protein
MPSTLDDGILIRRIRHCEKRSDEAIQFERAVLDCFAFGSQ